MPLPFIAAGIGIGAGLVAAYNYFTEDDNVKKGTGHTPPSKKELTPQKERELDFLIRLATSAAHADGVLCESEKKVIEKVINKAKSDFKSSEFLNELTNYLDQPDSFENLNRRWQALGDNVKEFEKTVSTLIREVIDADKVRTEAENAFLYRCKLMLSGLPDQQLYMLTDNVDANSTLSLEYLLKDKLPPTLTLSTERKGEMLLIHPANIHSDTQELIPISYLLSDSFLTSQDTELVNAARVAGAKKVRIFIDSKSSSSISADIDSSVESKAFEASSNVDVADSFRSSDKKIIVYEFQGQVTSVMNKLKTKFHSPEKELLKNSKWLQYDEDLTEFVRSCFSDNKLKLFSKEISTMKQRNVVSSAKLAIDCKILKGLPSAKADLEAKAKLFDSTEKKYEVYF